MPLADESIPPLAVLDASVAVRWVVAERGSKEAAGLLARPVGWLAPRLMLTEAAGALRRKTAGAELDATLAAQALDALADGVEGGLIHLADDETLVSAALLLAIGLKHRVPDCMYLALAEREGAALATADARLASLAKSRGVEVWKVPAA
jgi:predicted nucleic acid-binding protein